MSLVYSSRLIIIKKSLYQPPTPPKLCNIRKHGNYSPYLLYNKLETCNIYFPQIPAFISGWQCA